FSGGGGCGNPVGRLIRQTASQQRPTLALNTFANLLLAVSEGLTFLVIFQAARLLNTSASPLSPGWSGPLASLGQSVAALGRGQQFLLLLGLAVALQLLMSLARYANGVSIGWFSARCQGQIIPILHRYLLSLSFACASRYRVGHLIAIAGRAPQTVQIQILESESLLSNMLLVGVYLAALLLLSPWLSLVAIAMALLIAALQRILRPRIRSASRRQLAVSRQMAVGMTEDLQLLRLLHSSATLAGSQRRVEAGARELQSHMLRLSWLTSLLEPVSDLLPVLAAAAIGGLSWFMFQGKGQQLIPNLVTFVLIIQRLNLRLARMGASLNRLTENSASLQDLQELLNPADKQFRRRGGIPFQGLQHHIVFDNVSLRYPGRDQDALHDISLRLPRGGQLALVGESGSGKSSLVDLLVGLYAPTAGTILVDGLDLGRIDLDGWQRQLGVVSQDVQLCNGSIAANIAFGCPDATAEQIAAAARAADAEAFILTLPEQYGTVIGERGFRLSGGQRQRLSLARVLLQRPQLLILDEATSALDSLSEARILDTIRQVSSTITLLCVAHRLSSICQADQIVVLADGRLVESGRHEQLLQRGGLYADLWRRQADQGGA
ncbi:MAG: ABC transporter ATP-binding protein, partial [Synechococcaceae cyanobacterium]|nr:ABC transporter ATP-binding protein [Synechococcaceae cyanobacterium]